jgi:hypothetical protein
MHQHADAIECSVHSPMLQFVGRSLCADLRGLNDPPKAPTIDLTHDLFYEGRVCQVDRKQSRNNEEELLNTRAELLGRCKPRAMREDVARYNNVTDSGRCAKGYRRQRSRLNPHPAGVRVRCKEIGGIDYARTTAITWNPERLSRTEVKVDCYFAWECLPMRRVIEVQYARTNLIGVRGLS